MNRFLVSFALIGSFAWSQSPSPPYKTGALLIQGNPTTDSISGGGSCPTLNGGPVPCSLPILQFNSSDGVSRIEFRADKSARNTFVGVIAGLGNTTGQANTAIGNGALSFNTTGIWNTVAGVDAMSNSTTGSLNSAFGVDALYQNANGSNNSALGAAALHFNTTGSNNAAFGVDALENNSSGNSNVAIGLAAMISNKTGDSNVAVGGSALSSLVGNYFNTAIGVSALAGVNSYGNTGLGYNTLSNLTIGSNNTGVGFNTAVQSAADTNETVIGSGAAGAGSNTVTLGNTSVTKTVLNGTLSWSVGTDAPSGSCTTGSLYSNSTGTTLATTMYACVNSAWLSIP